jgi:hypothetical protein
MTAQNVKDNVINQLDIDIKVIIQPDESAKCNGNVTPQPKDNNLSWTN